MDPKKQSKKFTWFTEVYTVLPPHVTNMSTIDAEIEINCSNVVRSHQEALPVKMKEMLELSIAMFELADNEISKTHDHHDDSDDANRIIQIGLDFVLQYSRILQKRMNWQLYYKVQESS